MNEDIKSMGPHRLIGEYTRLVVKDAKCNWSMNPFDRNISHSDAELLFQLEKEMLRRMSYCDFTGSKYVPTNSIPEFMNEDNGK